MRLTPFLSFEVFCGLEALHSWRPCSGDSQIYFGVFLWELWIFFLSLKSGLLTWEGVIICGASKERSDRER